MNRPSFYFFLKRIIRKEKLNLYIKKFLKKCLKFILRGSIIITEDKTSDSPLAMDKK